MSYHQHNGYNQYHNQVQQHRNYRGNSRDSSKSIETANQRVLELQNRTGFPCTQINGQRAYGPPPNWLGAPPPKGCEVFVGKIPRDCFEDELVPVFSKIGPIYMMRLMMDFSDFNRGYGFVMYTKPEDAADAVRKLNDYQIRRGCKIGVVPSKDNCRLFVGRIPRDKSKEDVLEAMKDATAGVVDVIIHQDHMDPTQNRGYAFVEYESHRDAAMARRNLLPGTMSAWGCDIQVDWAQPEHEPDDTTMSQVSNLYVRNLHQNTSENDLMNLFAFGGSVTVLRVRRFKDFAFVHYDTRTEAEKALSKTSVANFGSYLAADGGSLHVTWAKPPNTNKPRIRRNPFPPRGNHGNGWQTFSPVNAGGGDAHRNSSWPSHAAFSVPQDPFASPLPTMSQWPHAHFIMGNMSPAMHPTNSSVPNGPTLFSPEIQRMNTQPWFTSPGVFM